MKSKLLGAGALVALITTFLAPAATAEIPSGTGGDVSPPGDQISVEVQSQSRKKMELAEAYLRAREGGSVSDFEKKAREYQVLWGESKFDVALERLASIRSSEKSATSLSAASFGYKDKVLNVQHYGQTEDYYCGPATGRMILKYLGAGTSAYNGAAQNQAQIASAAHMRTDINGKTGWDTDLFRIGMNRWRQGTNTGAYTSLDSPSSIEFRYALALNIDANFPFGADTVEFAGGLRYNGHPNNGKNIGHWIVVEGYWNYGDSTRFMDPSTTIWSGPLQQFSYTTNSFVNNFLQTNGITW